MICACVEKQQCIRIDPNFAEAYSNLGNALKELGDVVGAIQFYLKVNLPVPGDSQEKVLESMAVIRCSRLNGHGHGVHTSSWQLLSLPRLLLACFRLLVP